MARKIQASGEVGNLVVYNPSDSHLSVLKKFVRDKVADFEKAKVLDAQTKGSQAALEGDFEERDNLSAVDRAYNAAAYEVLLNTNKTEFDNELTRLYQSPDYNAAPAELEIEGQKLARQFASDLPPAVIPEFMVRAGDKISQYSRQAKSNQMQVTLNSNEAAFNRYETSVLRDISNSAEDGYLHVTNNFRADYLATLETQGPIENGGTGVLTEDEIRAKVENVDKTIQEQLILGEFRRTPEIEKLDFIRETQTSDRLEDFFDADGKKKIVNGMLAELRQEISMREMEEAVEKENHDKLADSLYKDWIDEPTIENAEAARPYVTPSQYEKIVDGMQGDRFGDDPAVVEDAERRFWRGELDTDTILDMMGQGLSRTTVKEYMNRVRDQEENAGFTTTEDWKEYKRRMDVDFPVATNAFGIRVTSGENVDTQGRISTRMYDTLRSEWVAWQNGDLPEKPDILRHYQLIQKAETDLRNRKNEGRGNRVPDKYRTNPKALVEDFDAGILPKNLRDEYETILKQEGVIK